MNKLVIGLSLLVCLCISPSLCAWQWVPVNVTSNTSLPSPRYHHAFTTMNNTAVVVGGYNFDLGGTFLADTWTFNFTNSTWKSVNATGLSARAFFTAGTNGSQVVVFAGTGVGYKAFNDVRRLELNNNNTVVNTTWANSTNSVWSNDTYYYNFSGASESLLFRQYHASVVIGGIMYVMGGHIYAIDRTGNDLVAYNLTSKVWKVLTNDTDPASPPARQGHSIISYYDNVWGQSLIVFGGYADYPATSGYNDVWQFVLKTGKWQQVAAKNPPPGRYSHSAAAFGPSTMIVYGGMSTTWNGTVPTGDVYFGDVWALQLAGSGTATWNQVVADTPVGPGRRQGHSVVVVNNQIFTFFGYQQYAGLKNDVWVLVNA